MPSSKFALISVSDKTGLLDLVQALLSAGHSLIASDGTANYLVENGIKVLRIEEITGSKELFGGRVKSLHPKIHGAILFDRNDAKQVEEAKAEQISEISVVIVNLYSALMFDIGGPALIRAAAKNHKSVAVLTSPKQYQEFIAALSTGITVDDRKRWALAAIEVTARYDLSILEQMGSQLRYGENPHQSGTIVGSSGVAAAWIHQGKELSFNNYLDLDIASQISADHPKSTFVIVKHGMPCGVATRSDQVAAFQSAFNSDSLSAFGGVIAANSPIDEAVAREITKNFFEAVIAPSFSSAALQVFAEKPNLRVIELASRSETDTQLREINGGFLFQTPDNLSEEEDWTLVSGEPATERQMQDLRFAWRTVARCRSNSVLIAKDLTTVGTGIGEVNRVAAAKQAVLRAGSRANEAVAASDGFFPFPDGLEVLAASGVKAIVAPAGSIRDNEVSAVAKCLNLTLYFSNRRHFSHS